VVIVRKPFSHDPGRRRIVRKCVSHDPLARVIVRKWISHDRDGAAGIDNTRRRRVVRCPYSMCAN